MSSVDYKLTPEELAAFNRKGYIGPFTLFSPNEMNAIYEKLRFRLLNTKTAIYNQQQKAVLNTMPGLLGYDRHLDVPFLMDLVANPAIVEKVKSILGDNLLCWRSELFPKYPGDEGTDWHQARTFGAVAGDRKPHIEWPVHSEFAGTINVWTALTTASIDNGCLQFMPGTHKTLFYDEAKSMEYDDTQINQITKDGVKRGLFGFDFRLLQVDPNWKPDESKAESMVMQPGQFIIFWSTLMHASHNHKGLTNDMRLGFSARYVPTCVKVYPYSDSLDQFGGVATLERYKSVLVSGHDEYGYNTIVEPDAIFTD